MSKPSRFDYGWVVVGVGALMTCVAFGSMLSLAVFLQPISQDMGWSRSGVSAAATIDFLAMGLAAFFWGTLSDRFGTRIVVFSGTLLLGAGLIGASQATSLWQFQFFFGILIGVAAGSFYAPMVAAASAWIEHHRSLAVALVSAGMGVSPLTVAPFASWLITTYDWRTAMLVIGVVALVLLIPASFLVQQPPAPVLPHEDVGRDQRTARHQLAAAHDRRVACQLHPRPAAHHARLRRVAQDRLPARHHVLAPHQRVPAGVDARHPAPPRPEGVHRPQVPRRDGGVERLVGGDCILAQIRHEICYTQRL